MGLVVMSARELERVEVLGQISNGKLTTACGAEVLGVTKRHLFRLLKRFREDGAPAIRHRARGRAPNNRISRARRDYALGLIREHYEDFGPTLAAEMLMQRHDLKVSRETLRKWMSEAGIWLSRKQRRQFHRPRLRRECFGELVQIDGCEHRWFEDRAEPCSLLVFIDDATSRLMAMRFVPSESTFSYFAALQSYLERHGRPVAFYSDKHSVFRVTKADAAHGAGMTQFGRALAELNIEILCANSSQAKGRVERAHRTLQDRLVKELRLAGISDIAAGNGFLVSFLARFNKAFAKPPARSDNLHRPLNGLAAQLSDILCWRERRHVSRQLAFSYQRQHVMLDETELTRGLAGQYVDTYAFADGRFEVRWKGLALSYQVFDKDQRVSQAAIVENKHLAEALSYIKQRQDKDPPKPRIKTNSEKTGYRSKGRKPNRKTAA